MTEQEHVSRRRFEREKAARQQAEELLEQKSRELFEKNRALEQLTDSLEEKVLERTKELERMKDAALEASRAKSSFLANMSHEVRTPLTAVIGFAENIQAGVVKGPDKTVAINMIVKNSRHLLRILDEVLEISKIEAEQTNINLQRFCIHTLLNELQSIYATLATPKGLEFSLNGLDDIPKDLVSDSLRVRQVLNNLIDNAIKFTDTGSVTIDVTFDKEEQIFTVKVKDSGIGISKNDLSKLFKSFSQADQESNRAYGGTGLGLAISLNYASLLGGNIEVSSKEGIGSTFTFWFPVEEYFDETQMDDSYRLESLGVQLFGHVLIVEDNEVNQLLIKQNLSILDVKIDVANNGEEGLEKALANDFDLILMDIQMPIMDGKEALMMLRNLGYNQPIVALTANVMKHDVEDYKELGFNDVIGKPIDKNIFYTTLKKYLQPSPNERSLAPDIGESIMQELNIKFVKSLVTYKQEIEAALDPVDHERLENQLHQLKGLCGSFNYDNLTYLSETIYKKARDNDASYLSGLPNLLDEITKIVSANE